MFHHGFVDATQLWRCRYDQHKMENKKNKPHNTHILFATPSDSRSSRLHVDIFWVCFIYSRYYILYIPLNRSVILLKSQTLTDYSSNSTSSYVTNCRLSLDINPQLSTAMNGVCPFTSANHQYVWAAYILTHDMACFLKCRQPKVDKHTRNEAWALQCLCKLLLRRFLVPFPI